MMHKSLFHRLIPVVGRHRSLFGDFGVGFASVFFAVLRNVEANTFALCRYAQVHHLVGEPVKAVRHAEGVDKYDAESKYVVNQKLRMRYFGTCSVWKEVSVGKDSCKHGSDDTAKAVGWEHVERVVNHVGFLLVGYCHVADDGSDERDEDALSHSNPSGRRGDGNQAHHSTDGCSHC